MLKKIDQEYAKVPCTRKVQIFEPLSNDEIFKIAAMTTHKKFKKGQLIIHEGEQLDSLFIINRGQIKLSKLTTQGKQQILHILKNGECFCELNILNPEEESNFSAYAMEETEICILTKSDMDSIMEKNPSIVLKLLKTVSQRLMHAENLVHNLAISDPEIRLSYAILELCEKYGETTDMGIFIDLTLTREEIANYIGVTRETVSRKFSKFEKMGLISSLANKKLIVKNKVALQNIRNG
jgi:CRP/FNR family transcriptional regulator, anaerobic regulatory protein